MTHSIVDLLRSAIVHYGYWAVAITLLLENMGIPLPGETILLIASFMAYSEQRLNLYWIIVFAIIACTVGDNVGYALGNHGGRPLLRRYQSFFRIRDSTVGRGEKLFERYGATTVFFARFVFGMRIIAGPLAGVLRMPWRKFVLYNFLGATVWVTVISGAGYLFGQHWERVARGLKRLDLILILVVVLLVMWRWYRNRIANGAAPPK
jgi:membrane protein DedA with SNARE-associated domain